MNTTRLAVPSRPSATLFNARPCRPVRRRHAMTFALALSLSVSSAQYSIDWFKIAGGGGTSTGVVFSVTSTIGQFDPGVTMTNGAYSLSVWALPAVVQTADVPTLHVTNAAAGFATIWWTPPTPSFVLQSADSLSPTNWVNAPSGTNNPASVPATLPTRFYRLVKP
jgi:hypothetical protein